MKKVRFNKFKSIVPNTTKKLCLVFDNLELKRSNYKNYINMSIISFYPKNLKILEESKNRQFLATVKLQGKKWL